MPSGRGRVILPRKRLTATSRLPVTTTRRPPTQAQKFGRCTRGERQCRRAAVTSDTSVRIADDGAEIEVIRERYPNRSVKIEREVTQDAEGNYVNHGSWKMWDLARIAGRRRPVSIWRADRCLEPLVSDRPKSSC